ncbi:hypothetical protein [Rhizobium sp. GR12]|uniref:hypothetical protein n=1 Tax=Rhizobium sp. GR12 TaxID=3053925 RepID=UPI002FBD2EEE
MPQLIPVSFMPFEIVAVPDLSSFTRTVGGCAGDVLGLRILCAASFESESLPTPSIGKLNRKDAEKAINAKRNMAHFPKRQAAIEADSRKRLVNAAHQVTRASNG